MNDLIQRIVDAIIRQEGESATALNPGNLRGAPWFKNPIMRDGFWVPASRAMGVAGLAHLVALHVAQANSLSIFIAGSPGVYAGFAPGADGNKPAEYIVNVMQWANVPDQDIALFNYIL